jgi:hypothetical protein
LEEKDKEEENTKEATSEEAIKGGAKQVSLLEEDEDEITPIKNLIRKQEIIVDPIDKGKAKEQKVEDKDETICIEGEWVGTKTRKMIYGVIAPRVEHPIFIEKASVKPYSKNIMVHMMVELEYVLPLLPNLETYYLLHCFQVCLRVGVALLVLRAHTTKNQFIVM